MQHRCSDAYTHEKEDHKNNDCIISEEKHEIMISLDEENNEDYDYIETFWLKRTLQNFLPGSPSRPGDPGGPSNPGRPGGPGNPFSPSLPGTPGGPGLPSAPGGPRRKHKHENRQTDIHIIQLFMITMVIKRSRIRLEAQID